MWTKIIKNLLPKPLPLGRWGKKQDIETWILNMNPDPGYQNRDKSEWIKKLTNLK